MAEAMCVVCRRREPTAGSVCNPDLLSMQALLDDLPRKLRRLPLMLVPGQAPAGDWVSTTAAGSGTPARMAALSLVGPGSTPPPDEDQLGTTPPAHWLDQWVRRWRAVFGHDAPTATPTRRPPLPPEDLVQWMLLNGTPEQAAVLVAAHHLYAQWRQGLADLVAGHEPGYGGNRPAGLREDDPLADAWNIRFGEPEPSNATTANIVYLKSWLVRAAERDSIDLGEFAAGLRSLSAELTRVLGEQPDQQRLGRCPTPGTDPDAAERGGYCGAELWQDPHASVVQCPRCHSSWGPRPIQLINLSAEIRRVWPLDRRRRYHADEIDALRDVLCPECGTSVRVVWQEVTATGDQRRWWRPAATRCPHGCAQAGQIL